MAIEVEIIYRKNYVEAIVAGHYNMNEAGDRFPLVLSACKFANFSKILINCLNLKGDISTFEKMFYAKKIIDHILMYAPSSVRDLKIAYLCKTDHIRMCEECVKMAEREAIMALVTDDSNKAYAWLGV